MERRYRNNRVRRLRRVIGRGAALMALLAAAVFAGLRIGNVKPELPTPEPGAVEAEIPEALPAGTEPLETEASPADESPAAEPLPERYDLREWLEIPAVPDQGNLGTCWAFAALTALTTSMPEELRQELSADHMSLQNSFGLSQDMGGDSSIAMAYLLAWQGPVAAKDDPYGDGVSPEGLMPVCHVQEVRILEAKDYEAIKRAVYEIGGVQSALYYPPGENTVSFYYKGERTPNHDVVIIGWDDAYPRERFADPPEQDGAFLCMNSWGESFGERGCFYVSYEDSQIGVYNVVYSGVESVDSYDRIYQTDFCGWTGQLGYGSSEAWFANVYRAEADESLEAVGLYATTPDTKCRIYVAKVSGYAEEEVCSFLRTGTPAAEAKFSESGFYTISLEPEFYIKSGERFAVIVEMDSPGTGQPVAMEYRPGNRTGKRVEHVDAGDGEGYISYDGSAWERADSDEEGYVCLKAYSREHHYENEGI